MPGAELIVSGATGRRPPWFALPPPADRPQECANMAHRQRDLIRGVLPRVKAHLRVRREMHGFHGDSIWMRRYVVGQHQDRRLAAAHEIARHGVDEVGRERYMLVRKVSTIAIVMSGRRAHSSGPQLSCCCRTKGGPPGGSRGLCRHRRDTRSPARFNMFQMKGPPMQSRAP